jgi:hypothetical protein
MGPLWGPGWGPLWGGAPIICIGCIGLCRALGMTYDNVDFPLSYHVYIARLNINVKNIPTVISRQNSITGIGH